MGCLIVIIALAIPRAMMFFIWLLTGWFHRAFDSTIWPLLGFLFMPYTTLAYMVAMLKNSGSVSGLWIVLVVFAVMVDVGNWHITGRPGRFRRRRR